MQQVQILLPIQAARRTLILQKVLLLPKISYGWALIANDASQRQRSTYEIITHL